MCRSGFPSTVSIVCPMGAADHCSLSGMPMQHVSSAGTTLLEGSARTPVHSVFHIPIKALTASINPDEHIDCTALVRQIHDLHAISHVMQETGGRGAVQAIQIRGSGSGSDNWTPMQNVWGAEWVSETGWWARSYTLRRTSIHCC